ncbi:MAG TPA: S-layer homology domain-containing protein, partial [Candidatus Galloscillospira excrementipullorum]|nr:S-layer homology domain-containing protein [Candidatus Galloscillospira excrementipullorum]
FSDYEVADNAYEASVTTGGTTTTYATVEDALEAVATSGGTVNLLVDEATVESLSLTIAGEVEIKGTGTIDVTVEDLDDKNTSVFTIQNTGSLTLDGVKMVVNGVPNETYGSDGTAFTLYGKDGDVGSEVFVINGGELWIQNINKGFIMGVPAGVPAPSTAKVTVKNGVLNASGIDGNFSNGGEFVFDHATVDIKAGVDQVSEWVGHALSVHKLTATASKITASATKYGLNITDEGGKVELLEGSTLEVKDSGTKFDDGTAAANMQKGSTLVVDKTSTLSVTGTNNMLHLDEAGTSVLLGTVEADMNTVPYIYAVGFKANAADANETINKLFAELADLVGAENAPAPITDSDDNTMFVLFTGTGTTDTYTLTVTDKDGATIYTEEHPNATKGGVIYFTFEQDGGSHTKKPIASGTYTLEVKNDESKVVGTTDITLAKVSFTTDSGEAPAAFYGAAGDTVMLPDDKPTKTGYNFAGWKNETAGEDAETFKAGAEYLMGETDVTLTAQWNRRNSGGGAPSGGGGSAVTEYAVTVSTADNGSVAVSPKNAEKGDTVTVTVTPDEGYVLESLTVTDKDGDKVSTTKGEDGKYTFTMPGSAVTVKAVFAEEGTVSELPFEDVSVDQWFYEAVKYVYDNELMNGVSATEFNPNGLLTRGTIAQVLFNLEGADADAAAVFDDVPADAWFADAVNWAAANNIVTGYGDGTFGPDNNITREQMAAILYRYAQFKGYDVSAKGDLTAFTDGDNVSEWATDALAWCVGAKLINGRDNGTVDATGTATRAEIAQIFMNFCENIAK